MAKNKHYKLDKKLKILITFLKPQKNDVLLESVL